MERYSISLRISSECGKIRPRRNSAFGHFSRSALISETKFFHSFPISQVAVNGYRATFALGKRYKMKCKRSSRIPTKELPVSGRTERKNRKYSKIFKISMSWAAERFGVYLIPSCNKKVAIGDYI